jgi:hypothetical protein
LGELVVIAIHLALTFNYGENHFERIFGIGSRAVQAYGCVHCRNLQFTVEFSEGEQPDVLERINSNPKKLEG